MAEDNTGVGGQLDDDGQTSKPAEPTVVINNRAVPVTEAPGVLRQMEHDLKSGYDRKLESERQAIKAALNADKQFYATTDPAAWEFYEPTVDGGRGWVGQGEPVKAGQQSAAPTQSTQTKQERTMPTTQETPTGTQATPAFNEGELAAIRTKQAELDKRLYEQDVAQSIRTRDALATKYPDADISAVTAQMKAWDLEHGGQACPADVVDQFMNQSHAFVSKRIEAVKAALGGQTGQPGAPKSATPPVAGGTPPTGGKAVTPKLSNPDAFADYIAGKV